MQKAIVVSMLIITFFSINTSKAFGQEIIPTTENGFYITSVEITPWGIMSGEFDQRAWKNPFNGIKISKDKGVSWTASGLKNRGITDLHYQNGIIYAATYYFVEQEAGLFVSYDAGINWTHLGNNFSTTKVTTSNDTIYLGTYSHGLWKHSNATGWKQLIGDGYFGPKITLIKAKDSYIVAQTSVGVYESNDFGETWTVPEVFKQTTINDVIFIDELTIAATKTGIYTSSDKGITWNKQNSLNEKNITTLFATPKHMYASVEQKPNEFELLVSLNSGTTWNKFATLPINKPNAIKDMTYMFSFPSKIYFVSQTNGIFYFLEESNNIKEPLLRIPWHYKKESELVSTITSYFDHEYPFSGYKYYTEPPAVNATTVNYLGQRAREPILYYSKHDGVDFALPYGTEIVAAHSGQATYAYEENGLGHHINVVSENGFQTTYAHMQESGLATKTTTWIEEGNKVGLVGLTGKTTGPHLHFAVTYDKNENENFTDNETNGKTDPFGWQTPFYADPWATYTWLDSLGTHNGMESYYMWKNNLPKSTFNITNNLQNITHENISMQLPENFTQHEITISIQNHSIPAVPPEKNKLVYITGTSFLLNAYNNLGQEPPEFLKPVRIEIDFSEADLQNILLNTLSIYYLNDSTNSWEKVNSVLDLVNKKLTAETSHFSNYAVFAEKIDYDAPNTIIAVIGAKTGNWFTQYPTIELSYNDADVNYVFYKLNNEVTWREYSEPFELQKEGINKIEYKAVDGNNNWENAHDIVIPIDTKNKWKDTSKVSEIVVGTETQN
ncbi:MAG: peptidoglycan DD-metalloendopeptidase family protein [Patescibacteria group bacterium]